MLSTAFLLVTKSSPPLSSLNRSLNGNLELTLTISWSRVQKAYDSAVAEAVASTQVPGFRKGKAPKDLVEPKLDRNHTLSHALGHLLPEVYAAAVQEHDLKPLLNPQIKIISGKEGESWTFLASTCEAPKVILPEKLKPLDKLVAETKVVIPDLLIEEEANHRLAALAENITSLGMTIEQYLTTKKLTAAELKAKLAQEAKSDLSSEFILLEVQKSKKLADRKATLEFLQKLV
ncbi:MAG: trigger factor [Patescibacteria group bacterium]